MTTPASVTQTRLRAAGLLLYGFAAMVAVLVLVDAAGRTP